MATLIVAIDISHETRASLLAAIENNRQHLAAGTYDQDNGNDGFYPWMVDQDKITLDPAYLRQDKWGFFPFTLRAVEE